MRYANLATQPVSQSEPFNERQVQNNAGGFVFAIDDWARLDRFLVLGSDAPTYYQSAKALTRENAKCVERCFAADPIRTVARIVEISVEGRAPKNDAAIFALALGAVNVDVHVRSAAFAAVPKVCRIGTHLFQFVSSVRTLGKGWGRAMKRAVAQWYDSRPVDSVAYQAIKYRNREGYSHKRLLQSAHPAGDKTGLTVVGEKTKGVASVESERAALYRWICDKEYSEVVLPPIVRAHLKAMALGAKAEKKQLLGLIREYKLPWEAIPTDVTTDPDVWKAMLPGMGLTALIRNLGGMTQYGALKPLEPDVQIAVKRLTDDVELKKARIHPFNVLLALAVYRNGQSVRGSRAWDPIPQIVDALDEAFYKSFKHVVPTGKRTLIGLDVSGSMSSSLMGSPLEVCEGVAAMAMVTMRAEENWTVCAFDEGMRDLKLTAKSSLANVLEKTRNINGGGTDCALPMIWALQKGLSVDVFQVYTDNDTWAGQVHPVEALKEYRRKTGIPAKLVVTGMTATNFSIADPNDAGMLDVCGFGSDAPAVIADFARQ